MPRKSLKSDDVTGFIIAFHDEVTDTAKRFGVTITTDLRLGPGRGQFSVHQLAHYVDDLGSDRLAASVWVAWPSVKYTSLHAMLYNLACRLNIAVQQWHREMTGEWYSTPVE